MTFIWQFIKNGLDQKKKKKTDFYPFAKECQQQNLLAVAGQKYTNGLALYKVFP